MTMTMIIITIIAIITIVIVIVVMIIFIFIIITRIITCIFLASIHAGMRVGVWGSGESSGARGEL